MFSQTFGAKDILLKLNWCKWSQKVAKLLTGCDCNILLADLPKISFLHVMTMIAMAMMKIELVKVIELRNASK